MLHPVPFVYHKLGYANVGDLHTTKLIAGIARCVNDREYIDKQMRILLAHQGISEAHKFASEISAQDLPKNFDYYAMGHIHEKSEWDFDFLEDL